MVEMANLLIVSDKATIIKLINKETILLLLSIVGLLKKSLVIDYNW